MIKKVALITAASQGMGLACAKELKSQGYELALMSRSSKILAVAQELEAVAIEGSVTNQEDISKLVNTAIKEYGRIDSVINNTGHPAKGPLLQLTKEDWHQGLDLIITSVAEMLKLVIPIMQKQGGGSIVNISTFAAFEPNKNFPISSALRAALGSYIKLVSDEYAKDKIRINNVLPGYVDSYPVDHETVEKIPMGRPGTVEEIAQSLAFLLSESASYMTGQNITIDGGITRSI